MAEQIHKAHRPSNDKRQHSGGPSPKAFGFAKPGKLNKQAARSNDIKEKRLHVPLVDRIPEEAPPIVVGVVGPPGVGKTTLIKSLIRRYAKQTLSAPVGPLTVVTSKRRRLTFLECPANSLASMIDVAKIVDIVLLMIDGNYGFEMETMEFLNVLNATGMPGNIFGILTHLDLFRKQDALRAQKKRLKHRFWSELYQGAKLFYLSGVINGRYPDREILNLSRFLSVMKNPRPLVWRNSHPYCLVDRYLDITPPTEIEANSKCDRTVALYGFLRGTNFPAGPSRVHIPGVGDLSVSRIEGLPDPCPTPFMEQAIAKATGKEKRRRLGEKQKILFAPMSDVGGVLVDQDAVYIDVRTETFSLQADPDAHERGLGEQMVLGLQNGPKVLGATDGGVRLFSNGNLVDAVSDTGRKSKRQAHVLHELDDEGITFSDSEHDDNGLATSTVNGRLMKEQAPKSRRTDSVHSGLRHSDHDKEDKLVYQDSDSDLGSISSVDDQELNDENPSSEITKDDSDEETEYSEADDVHELNQEQGNQEARRFERPFRTEALTRLMYDLSLSPEEASKKWRGELLSAATKPEESQDEDFFARTGNYGAMNDQKDGAGLRDEFEMLESKWANQDNLNRIQKRFISTKSLNGANFNDDMEDFQDSDDNFANGDHGMTSDEGDGVFEDLEADENSKATMDEAESLEAERERNAIRKEQLKSRFEEEDREGFTRSRDAGVEFQAEAEEFGEDQWFDAQKAQIQRQLDINKTEFESMDNLSRLRMEGHRAGTYARIILADVPYEFCNGFDPRVPIIIGGLTPTEDRLGFVQVRIKRHRWYKKILKTNDPLFFSLGWRRFQTMPVYSISDSRTRNRMLKYTPEHMFCFGTFYGPLIAPNTGFCCVQSFSSSNPGFRVAATGVVLSVDEGTEIVKKLKLTGHAYKIFKNTAFIKDMFASALEIAKFEGASIRTVSGIRGQIKRALSKPDGCFRATFEDKILMSDIIFLKAWYPVKPHRFYNPVTNLLVTPAVSTSKAAGLQSDDPHNSQNGDGTFKKINETENDGQWTAMKLTGQLRAEQNIPTPLSRDSAYRAVVRSERHFNPLRVPKKLSADLPFASQPVVFRPQTKKPYLQQRMEIAEAKDERRKRALMQQIETVRKDKTERRAQKQGERRQGYQAKVRENLEKKAEREKREKEEFWRVEGRKRKLAEQKQSGPSRSKKARQGD